MIRLFKNKKRKAIAFVDYEYWFYSCKERFNLYPNLQRWKDEIAKRFELKDIMVFGDFSHENIAGDLHKVRSITNTVIETSNTFMRKKKDMTDFIMLDYIYQTLEQQKGIDTYILFTGDGHFQTVVKCLKEKKKRVIVCGIEDSFSKQLRDTASEVIMVDIEKELNSCETKEQFAERLKANLMYYFWSKAEWEVVISAWVGGDALKKIDVYTQVMNNFDVFLDYVWSFKDK